MRNGQLATQDCMETQEDMPSPHLLHLCTSGGPLPPSHPDSDSASVGHQTSLYHLLLSCPSLLPVAVIEKTLTKTKLGRKGLFGLLVTVHHR